MKRRNVSLKDKVNQLFISKNPDDVDELERFIQEGIGGFMIGKGGEIISFNQKDMEGDSAASLKKFVSEIKRMQRKYKKIPLFLAIDGEGGGYFNRLKSFSTYKSQRVYGKQYEKDGDLKSFQKEVGKYAKLMNKMGLNMNFAPLIDVAKKGYKGYVAEEKIKVKKVGLTKSEVESSNRAYSDNPETVSALANAAMKVFQEHKIIPTLKHFPSYGILNENENPHIMLPKPKISRKRILKQTELYGEAFREGAWAVMTGHMMTPLDLNKPASLSKKTYAFLRKKLKFKGLVVVDELNMGAITEYYGFASRGKSAVDAIKSNDIILISHPDTFISMRNAVLDAAKEYKEVRDKVNDSYKRIMKHKKMIGIVK